MIKVTLKNAINNLIDIDRNLDILNKAIIELHNNYEIEKELELNEEFKKLLTIFPNNIQIIKKYIDFIRLVQSEKLSAEFELHDIENWYSVLTNIYKNDMEIKLDKLHYLFSVMDKENDAKIELNSFKLYIYEQIKSTEEYFCD